MFSGDDRDGPVVPNPMHQARMCRWRESRNRWHRASPDRIYGEDDIPPTRIELVTWNVSYDTPMVRERMESVLRHLEKVVFKCRGGEAPEPCVVLLQEVHALNGLDVILRDEWVREHFLVTPTDASKWPDFALYGNVTLVEKSIPVQDAHILEFGLSAMQRTGVIVDIRLAAPNNDYDVILRVINTHLESLPGGDEVRPKQLQLLSKFLKGSGVRGGLIAGDMNPIGAKDGTIPAALGLRDAWRKGEKDERGFTWGQQPPCEHPAARFDKILYLPRKGYRVDEPQRIGVGLRVANERLPGGWGWASDHCGLLTKSLLLAAVLVAGAAAQITINTPSGTDEAAECEPFLITWSGGTPPYFIVSPPFVFVETSPQTTPVATFNGETGTQQTWTVNATENSQLLFTIRDSNGLTATTGVFGVVAGSGDSCLTGSTNTSGAPPSSPPATTSGGAPTTATSPGGSSPTTGGSPSGASKAPTSSGSAKPTTSGSAGYAVGVPAGVLPAFAAVLGAIFVTLLA
ncbi:Endonuclease/exonuclease/phosphatase [Mycena galericulata]|nr:Endonuclease/exonuclease/phosphatase [Mycena galericulata]